jgi:hypothetical protein
MEGCGTSLDASGDLRDPSNCDQHQRLEWILICSKGVESMSETCPELPPLVGLGDVKGIL